MQYLTYLYHTLAIKPILAEFGPAKLNLTVVCRQGRRRRGVGSRGSGPPTFENRGGRPSQKFRHFSIIFLKTSKNFAFSNILKTKWPKSEEKLNFEGSWVQGCRVGVGVGVGVGRSR